MNDVKLIKKLLKKLFPQKAWDALVHFKMRYLILKYKEKRMSFGNKNPDKTFLVIRRIPCVAGLLSNFHHVLDRIMYSIENNYVPVVDMENYKTFNNVDEPINGTKNAWEYYFQQPGLHSLSEVYESKNVILSNGVCEFTYGIENDENAIKSNHSIIKNHMKFNTNMENHINSVYNRIIGKGKKVLGVSSRQTDFVVQKPKGHSIQPTIEELIETTKKYYKEWNADIIFLKAEDSQTINAFRKEFRNILVTIEKMEISNYDGSKNVAGWGFERPNDAYLRGVEYLTEVAILSRCDFLVARDTQWFHNSY